MVVESRETRVGGCDDLLREIEEGVFFPRLVALGWSPVAGESGSVRGAGGGNGASAASSGTSVATTATPTPLPYLNYRATTPHTSTFTPAAVSSTTSVTPTATAPVAPTAPALARALQRQSLALMDAFSSSDGSRVDYTAMRVSSLFVEYCRLSTALAGGWVMNDE